MLGYAINTSFHRVPKGTVRQFQRDYNKCSDRFGQWGKVEITGRIDKDTLNALEHAIRWSKKRENKDGTPSARSWLSLCGDRSGKTCGECDGDEPVVVTSRKKIPEESETNYVEITPQGTAKLRSVDTDIALRAEVVGFEREGDVVFAVVKIPPQADLPGGREKTFQCPCVLSR